MSQIEKLCDILLRQNLVICKSIAPSKFTEKKLYKYFLESAQEIKLLKKTIAKPLDGLPVELRMTKGDKRKIKYKMTNMTNWSHELSK